MTFGAAVPERQMGFGVKTQCFASRVSLVAVLKRTFEWFVVEVPQQMRSEFTSLVKAFPTVVKWTRIWHLLGSGRKRSDNG